MGRATGRTRHSWAAPISRSLVVSLHLHCRRASAENLSCLEIRLPSRSIDSIICARSGWSRQVFDRSFRCSSRGQGKSLSHMRHVCIPTDPSHARCNMSSFFLPARPVKGEKKQKTKDSQKARTTTTYQLSYRTATIIVLSLDRYTSHLCDRPCCEADVM